MSRSRRQPPRRNSLEAQIGGMDEAHRGPCAHLLSCFLQSSGIDVDQAKTRAPPLRQRNAVPRPNPEAAPVTRAGIAVMFTAIVTCILPVKLRMEDRSPRGAPVP